MKNILKKILLVVTGLFLAGAISVAAQGVNIVTPILPAQVNHSGEYLQTVNNKLLWAPAAGGGGVVTSVGLSAPTGVFDVTGSPVTGAGTLALTFDTQTANTVFAGPSSGGAATPTFRALVANDIPALPYLATALPFNHLFVGNVSNVAVDGGADVTWTQSSRSLVAGDTTSASGGGVLSLLGNSGTMLFSTKVNSVNDSIVVTANNISGTGLSAGFGDLSDSIASGAGVRMLAQINNAGSTNNVKVTNGLGNTFFNVDVGGGLYGLGAPTGIGNETKLTINDADNRITINDSNNDRGFFYNGAAAPNGLGAHKGFGVDFFGVEKYTWGNNNTGQVRGLIDNVAQTAFLGMPGVGVGKLNIDIAGESTMLVAGNDSGTSTFAMNFVMDASVGSVAITDTAGIPYFNINQDNISAGLGAGSSLTTGIQNAFFGEGAGENVVDGTDNAFVGYNAGNATVDGSFNTYVGGKAGFVNVSGQGNTYIGRRAASADTSGSNNVVIGKDAAAILDGGSSNFIGGQGVAAGLTTGGKNVIIGDRSTAGAYDNANSIIIGATTAAASTGADLFVIGTGALFSDTSSFEMTVLGNDAGSNVDGATRSILIGGGVAASMVNSTHAIVIGHLADGSGSEITGLGYLADLGTGDDGIVIGSQSGSASMTGDANTILGTVAGQGITSGHHNTLLGFATDVPSGNRSYGIALGAYAQTGTNTLAIGGDDGSGSGGAAYINQVVIGNGSVNEVPHDLTIVATSALNNVTAADTSGAKITLQSGGGTGTALSGGVAIDATATGVSSDDANSSVGAVKLFNGNGVTTSTASTVDLPVIKMDADGSYTVKAYVTARCISGAGCTAGNTNGYEMTGVFKTVAGTLTAVGTPLVIPYEDEVLWNATWVLTGNIINVRVTPAANSEIIWKVGVEDTRIEI